VEEIEGYGEGRLGICGAGNSRGTSREAKGGDHHAVHDAEGRVEAFQLSITEMKGGRSMNQPKDDARKYSTSSYQIFKPHKINRDLGSGTVYHKLESSLLKDGWWPKKAMIVYPADKDGKHTVLDGHNRFAIAKKHGIKVIYEIDPQRTPLPKFQEPTGRDRWSLADWVASHYKADENLNYAVLYNFQKRTGIPMAMCIQLFMFGTKAPERTESNWSDDIRNGTLRIADIGLAESVESIVAQCVSLNVVFARSSGFVRALSLLLRFGVVKVKPLKQRIESHVAEMLRKQYVRDYLSVINDVYNYKTYPKVDLPTELKNAMAEERRRLGASNLGIKRKPKAGQDQSQISASM
jgi:hypothetical protein